MYEKNLTEDFRLRLSSVDMEFLKKIANERSVSVSECVRSIIGEYRRSIETLQALQKMVSLATQDNKGMNGINVSFGVPASAPAAASDSVNDMKGMRELSNGDTKTDIDDKL